MKSPITVKQLTIPTIPTTIMTNIMTIDNAKSIAPAVRAELSDLVFN